MFLLTVLGAIISTVHAQTPGVNFICVSPGTCITNNTGGGSGVIDPRIVTPGGSVTTFPPVTSCPPGTVACYGIVDGNACGRRYVTNVPIADGQSVNGAYPWQVFIRNQTGYTGSGVLLDANHVLTAAHKVNLNQGTPGNLEVYVGVYNPTDLTSAQRRTVTAMRIHPSFSATTLRNDIAVLRLNTPISLGYQINVGTACLPSASASYVGRRCTVSGWGQTAFNVADAPTSPQRQVTVPIVSYATCRASMAQSNVLGSNVDIYLDTNELCAGGEANRDACTQDGGAPLVCEDNGRFNIAGLVIWGKNCGQPNIYGVYVDVAKYRSWVDSAVNELTFG